MSHDAALLGLNNPEATAITPDEEGYLHTRDVATVTEEGPSVTVDMDADATVANVVYTTQTRRWE